MNFQEDFQSNTAPFVLKVFSFLHRSMAILLSILIYWPSLWHDLITWQKFRSSESHIPEVWRTLMQESVLCHVSLKGWIWFYGTKFILLFGTTILGWCNMYIWPKVAKLLSGLPVFFQNTKKDNQSYSLNTISRQTYRFHLLFFHNLHFSSNLYFIELTWAGSYHCLQQHLVLKSEVSKRRFGF